MNDAERTPPNDQDVAASEFPLPYPYEPDDDVPTQLRKAFDFLATRANHPGDYVKDIRAWNHHINLQRRLFHEAADEIERLRDALREVEKYAGAGGTSEFLLRRAREALGGR